MTLSASDRFCLDGQQLFITSSGTYGASGTTYQTEITNFSNVTASSTQTGNGPSYFTVAGKDGLYYEYGNPTDPLGNSTGAQAVAATSTTPYAWALDKVSDRAGNYLVIHYIGTGGTILPYTIQYTFTPNNTTGNTSTSYEVAFAYGSQQGNIPSGFVGGSSIQQPHVLDTITVTSSGANVRQYTLNYTPSTVTQRGLLTSIQECGGPSNTDCLTATSVAYQTGPTNGGVENPTVSTGITGAIAYLIDMNGDGRADLVYSTTSGTTSTWWVAFASASGGFGTPVNTGISIPAVGPVLVDNFLGNGKAQLLAPAANVWTLYQWNGSTFTSSSTGGQYIPNYSYATADVNGDGVPDLVSASTSTISVQMNTTSSGGSTLFSAPVTAYTIPSGQIVQILGNHSYSGAVQRMDFNGDGRDDIMMVISGSLVNQPMISGGSTTAPTFSPTAFYGVNLSPVNWNSDACTDLYYPSNNEVVLMGCNGSQSTAVPNVTNGTTANPITNVVVLDWDGDGITDLLTYNGITWSVALSSGGGGPKGTPAITLPTTGGLLVGDIDGDGLADLVAVGTSGAVTYGLHTSPGIVPDLANSFTDGYGMKVTPSYTSIVNGNYLSETGNTYPDPDWIIPYEVTSAVTASDGTGGTYSLTLAYYYLRINLQGRGLDGFETKRTIDSRNGTYDYTYYGQWFPYVGMQYEDEWLQSDDKTFIREVFDNLTYLTLTSTAGTKEYYPYYGAVTESDYGVAGSDNGTLVRTVATTYDKVTNYGNVQQTQTTTTDNDPNSPWKTEAWVSTLTQTFQENTANWCISLPTVTTLENSLPNNGPSATRTTNWTPDYPHCRMTERIDQPNSSTLQVATVYAYSDGCGNINSTTVTGQLPSGTAMTPRVTDVSYGTRCQLPEAVTKYTTSSTSETTQINYDYSKGVPLNVTDPNGAETQWAYDDFARVTQMTRPDNTYQTLTLNACSTSNSYCGTPDFRSTVTLREYAPGGSTENTYVYLYYDGFDRLRVKQVLNLAAGVTDYYTYYDQLGRISVRYVPFSTGAEDWHQYGYDFFNRQTADVWHLQSGTVNRQTTTSYIGQEAQFTDAKGNITKNWINVLGQLGEISDPSPGGNTTYAYDPFGNLASITDPLGHTQVWSYDINGHLISSSDPDRGPWSYSPDSLGDLISQKDAKSQTISFTYDALGRMTTRTENEDTSTWTWGSINTKTTTDHNYDRLVSMSLTPTTGAAYSESYGHDTSGRLTSTTYNADVTYTANYTYNSTNGFLGTVTYPASTGAPSPPEVTYAYTYNILSSITDTNTGTVYWKMTAQDAWGHPTTEVLGNGVQIGSTYDPLAATLTGLTSGTASGYNNQQNLSYTYDLNNNLEDRKDLNQSSLDEHFTYDALNRIENSTLTGTSGNNLTVGLDSAGDITSMTCPTTPTMICPATGSPGTYTPDSTHVHAVASTSNGWQFTYDANGNMLTGRGYTITPASYNLPLNVTNGSGQSSTFYYTPDRRYWEQVSQYSGVSSTTVYVGGLMQKIITSGGTDYRNYIPAGSATVIVVKSTGSNANTYYATQDHLGSSAVITETTPTAGAMLVNESFAAYGERRGSNWTGSPSSTDLQNIASTTRQGFIGETMLDNLSLIHLNGRLYDPAIGQFTSPDPLPASPGSSQSANPYAYAVNQPLTLIDPTGLDPGNTGPPCYACISSPTSCTGNCPQPQGGGGIGVNSSGSGEGSIIVSNAFGTPNVSGGGLPIGGIPGASDGGYVALPMITVQNTPLSSELDLDALIANAIASQLQFNARNLSIALSLALSGQTLPEVCVGSGCKGRSTVPLVPATYPNGDPIINARTGQQLLLPQPVSIMLAARTGLFLRSVPRSSRFVAMLWAFIQKGPLDLQSRYSDNGNDVPELIDAGYYVYGVEAAAAGYSQPDTLNYAGDVNRGADHSGPSGTNSQYIVNTELGWSDFNSGKFNVVQ